MVELVKSIITETIEHVVVELRCVIIDVRFPSHQVLLWPLHFTHSVRITERLMVAWDHIWMKVGDGDLISRITITLNVFEQLK